MPRTELNYSKDLIRQIKKIMTEKEITVYWLAQKTGLAEPNIRRLFKTDQLPNLKTIVLICNELSIKIELIEK